MKPRTRAHYLGVSPAKFQSKARRFADLVRKRAGQIAYDWGDVDNFIVSETDSFLAALDQWEKGVKEGIERLREPEDGVEIDEGDAR